MSLLKAFFLLPAVFFYSLANGQGETFGNAWKLLELKGQVKDISIRKYKAQVDLNGHVFAGSLIPAIGGWLINTGDMQDSLLFNIDGQLVESYYMPYMDTSHVVRKSYTYNSKNKIVEKTVYTKHLSSRSGYKDIFEYDHAGSLQRVSHYFGGSDTASSWFVYSRRSSTEVFADMFLKDLGYRKSYLYQYDSLERLVTINTFDNKDSVYERTSPLSLNEQYYVMKNTMKDISTGNFNKYQYDDHHNWTQLIHYENRKPQYIITRQIRYWGSDSDLKPF